MASTSRLQPGASSRPKPCEAIVRGRPSAGNDRSTTEASKVKSSAGKGPASGLAPDALPGTVNRASGRAGSIVAASPARCGIGSESATEKVEASASSRLRSSPRNSVQASIVSDDGSRPMTVRSASAARLRSSPSPCRSIRRARARARARSHSPLRRRRACDGVVVVLRREQLAAAAGKSKASRRGSRVLRKTET